MLALLLVKKIAAPISIDETTQNHPIHYQP